MVNSFPLTNCHLLITITQCMVAAAAMNESASRAQEIRTAIWIAAPVIAGVLAISGCVAPRGWVYSATPPLDRPAVSAQTVVVPPLLDERPAENDNKVWLYWIPLVPFGWQDLNVPERHPGHINSDEWQFNPPGDLAAALAGEINNSRIFREAAFAADATRGDLVLQGRLSSTRYESRIYSYGVSIVAPTLWVIGLPMSSVKNTLAFHLRLEDRMSHKVLWEQSYSTEHRERARSLYNLPEDFSYDDMFKELIPKILADLEEAVRAKPHP